MPGKYGIIPAAACILLWPATTSAVELRRNIVGSFGAASTCGSDQLRGEVYDLPADTLSLPNFDKLKPTGKTICTNWLNIPNRQFLEGIPGVTSRFEYFGIDYRGEFWVDQPGAYMFSLLSDDGSELYIDGKRIIDNDGIHAALEMGGRAKLQTGKHTIRVTYFQGPREFVALVLKVAPPKGIFDFFDMRNYRAPATRMGSEVIADEARPILRRATAAHDPMAARAYEAPVLAALAADPKPKDFDIRAKVYRFVPRPVIAIEVPARSLAATPLADGSRIRMHLVLVALVKDPGGNVIQKISEDFPIELASDRAASLQSGAIRTVRALDLPPGLFAVQVVAADREANKVSTATMRLDVADRTAVGLTMSDLVAVRRIEPVEAHRQSDIAPEDPLQLDDRRVVPELAPSAQPGGEIPLYFAVYPAPDPGQKPSLQIEFSVDGKLLGKQSSPLPEPGADGVIRMSISAPARLGKNHLRVIVQQGARKVERVLEYSVAQ